MIYTDQAIALLMLRKFLNSFLYQSMILDVCVIYRLNIYAYLLKFKFASFFPTNYVTKFMHSDWLLGNKQPSKSTLEATIDI